MSMSMLKNKKRGLIERGNVSGVRQFLTDNPTFNINEDLNGGAWTALHYACSFGHHEVVSVLLAHPDINVNRGTIVDPLHFVMVVQMEMSKL